MAKRAIIFPLVGSLLIILLAFAMTDTDTSHSVGRIRIPEADIDTEIYIEGHEQNCGCCPSLWNGGDVTTTTDLSSVQIGDVADVITADSGHYVMECVEITHCIRVGSHLANCRGIVKAEGDVLVCVESRIWPIVTVYRLTRL